MYLFKIRIVSTIIFFVLFVLPVWLAGQNTPCKRSTLRVVFYNVENLFDPFNDSITDDETFMPDGDHRWTYTRFRKKCQDIGKVLIAAGDTLPPGIIGLCEVENRFTLHQLLKYTPLGKLGYKIIHYDSPDRRGIDVAMLYRPDKFKPKHHESVPVLFPDPGQRATRDILYVKGIALNTDTLHVFVNHWPSKYRGLMATRPLRFQTGKVLRSRIDSIYNHDPNANILIMGDLNDEPHEPSLTVALGARLDTTGIKANELFNLMANLYDRQGVGTHKFRESWSTIDLFIVSTSLLRGLGQIKVHPYGAQIFIADFLLEDDPAHSGKRPFRTYRGMQYSGGYSDHLPIRLDLIIKPTPQTSQ